MHFQGIQPETSEHLVFALACVHVDIQRQNVLEDSDKNNSGLNPVTRHEGPTQVTPDQAEQLSATSADLHPYKWFLFRPVLELSPPLSS